MTCGIYCLSFNDTDKVYVGSSINIEKRFVQHATNLINGEHHSNKLQKHYNKSNVKQSLKYDILLRCKEYELADAEYSVIEMYDSVKNGFNMTSKTSRSLSGNGRILLLRTLNERLLASGADLNRLSFDQFVLKDNKDLKVIRRLCLLSAYYLEVTQNIPDNVGVESISLAFPKFKGNPLLQTSKVKRKQKKVAGFEKYLKTNYYKTCDYNTSFTFIDLCERYLADRVG